MLTLKAEEFAYMALEFAYQDICTHTSILNEIIAVLCEHKSNYIISKC